MASARTGSPLTSGRRWLRTLFASGSILGCLGLSYWVLVRSCDADHRGVLLYAAYVVAMVWLPGHLLLASCLRGRPGLAWSLALGLPLGFAVEILIYQAAASLGWRDAFPGLVGLVSLMLGGGLVHREGWRSAMPQTGRAESATLLPLAGLALLIMATAASQMYAASPLDGGRLLHSTHHDWVYLVSRAAEIKNQWPFEDPSLAGTPLSYHYFLLVHVAAASHVTGLEIPMVLLRLVCVPMGAALLAQVFLLGKLLGGSSRVGVLAAGLLFATGEASQAEPATGGLFQALFLSWLYISPTFYFGMIFTGALLIWMRRHVEFRPGASDYAVLFLLAVVGTGAKGTTVGPLVLAAGMWCLWHRLSGRGWPWRMGFAGLTMTAGFAVAYLVFLRGYSGNGTTWLPFSFPSVSGFWLQHVEAWRAALATLGLPAPLGDFAAGLTACAVVLLGMNGVLGLGLIHGLRAGSGDRGGHGLWVGLVALACIAFGNLLFLDSHGESYLYLPMKLPLAALTAAALAAGWRRWATAAATTDEGRRVVVRWTQIVGLGVVLSYLVAVGLVSWWLGVGLGLAALAGLAPSAQDLKARGTGAVLAWKRSLRLLGFVPVLLVFAVQLGSFLSGNREGFALWRLSAGQARESELVELQDALDWLRRNTPTNVVIVASTFTPWLAGLDHARVVDRTSADKYYYYSALAERRLLVEGPAYLRDLREAGARMEAVADIVAGRSYVLPASLHGREVYLLYERTLVTDQTSMLPDDGVVFSNRRIRIYRLTGV